VPLVLAVYALVLPQTADHPRAEAVLDPVPLEAEQLASRARDHDHEHAQRGVIDHPSGLRIAA